jgi:hypothetical protein
MESKSQEQTHLAHDISTVRGDIMQPPEDRQGVLQIAQSLAHKPAQGNQTRNFTHE